MRAKHVFTGFLLALAAIFLALCICLLLFSAWNRPVTAEQGTAGEVLFSVPPGESLRRTASRLAGEGLVRSELFVCLHARFAGLSLKAGTYRLSPAMRTAEILDAIHSGDVAVYRITVPEGLTLSKTAAVFAEAGISAQNFLTAAGDPALLQEFGIPAATAEGYLFPDTYFVNYGDSAESVVRRMLSTFFERAETLDGFPGRGQPLHDRVILASIVEREYRVAEEAPLIAGVFANRLRINMGLQSCATIEYILTEILGQPHPERIGPDALEIRSPYNTYLWAGLPPGPISNPGQTALQAAFSPADTPCFYFRLNDPVSGTHTFTVSLDDHIEAGREIYLKQAAGR